MKRSFRRKRFTKNTVSKRSRTRVRSRYIKSRSKPSNKFKTLVQKSMTHKIGYSTPGPLVVPGFVVLAAWPDPACFNVWDSLVDIAQGTDQNQRLGNRIHVLYNQYHWLVQPENMQPIVTGAPPALTPCYMHFDAYAVKGEFANLLALLNDYFTAPGPPVIMNGASVSAFLISGGTCNDPALTGLVFKNVRVLTFPSSPLPIAESLTLSNTGPLFRRYKTKGHSGQLMFTDAADVNANSPRHFMVSMNLYAVELTVMETSKTVFVDAAK